MIQDTILDGSLLAAMPIALLAGLVSFLSPCVLPLVPGYLGYVTGITDPADKRRGRMVAGASLFVAGFSVVFLAIFVLIGTVGVFFLRYEQLILRIAGVLVIVMGLVFVGVFGLMQRQLKPTWRPAAGLWGAPLLGAVFAVGWTPCYGPTLVAAASLAVNDPPRAVVIGIAYCLGLGIPFLLVALGFGWVGSSVRWVKRHIRAINIVGGALLIVVGLLMVTGIWTAIMSDFQAVIGDVWLPL